MAMPMSEVTENLVLAGEGKTKRPQSQMVVLGIMAGALMAAGAMASSVAMHAISNAGLARLTAGLVFPIGFVLMALFGGELFTGDCLMVIGALKHRYRAIRMISVLCLVFMSNLLGGILFAGLVALSGQFGIGNGAVGAFTIKLALSKASLPFMSALVSGILCNFFVCIGVVEGSIGKDSGQLSPHFRLCGRRLRTLCCQYVLYSGRNFCGEEPGFRRSGCDKIRDLCRSTAGAELEKFLPDQ